MVRRSSTARLPHLPERVLEVVSVDVVERDVDKPLPELRPIPGAEFRRVTSAEAEESRDLFSGARWATAQEGFARGDEGYLALLEDRIAASVWVSRVTHRDRWSGLRLRLAPDEVYTYGLDADVRYRRLGAGAAVVAALLSDLQREANIRRVYGWIDAGNRESQALLRMVFGFTQVQTVKRARLLDRVGWQVPGSDRPGFGPVSRAGRHSAPSPP